VEEVPIHLFTKELCHYKTRQDPTPRLLAQSPTPSPTMSEDNNLNPWIEAKRLLIADFHTPK
jgi:hypothetical protein